MGTGTGAKFTTHQDALLIQKAHNCDKKWVEVLKDDFEDKTKIELKQRHKELENCKISLS